MYIPLDPTIVKGIWLKLSESLINSKPFHTVCNGEHNSHVSCGMISQDQINKLISQLKSADYTRVGSNRSNIEPVHFAIKFIDIKKAKLIELINTDNSDDTLRNEIELIIQLSFFDNPNLHELIIPLLISGIDDPDVNFEIDEKNQQTIVRRK